MSEPLAYFISFRCYGTWLHGDERRSIARRPQGFASELLEPDHRLMEAERALQRRAPAH